MKKALLLIISIILLMGFVFAAKEDNQGVPSLLTQIKEVLLAILEKLNIIAEKETTIIVEPNITVEPPQVTVNPNITLPDINMVDEMERRGNIIIREQEYAHTSGIYDTITKTNMPAYIALPNGNCSITISTDCSSAYGGYQYFVKTAKSYNELNDGEEFSCFASDCSGTININDEYYMIKIYTGSCSYSYMSLAYNCN